MKLWNIGKNLMLTLTLTMLYAIWSKDGLKECSDIHMWIILVLVGALIYHLLVFVDREVARIKKERMKKRGKLND